VIEDHRHCVVCGKPTDPDKTVCSASCEEILNRQQKSMKRSRLIMLVIFIVLFIFIILSSLLSKPA
jgi:predicted nucleic acid-binding Zn ribbon protein